MSRLPFWAGLKGNQQDTILRVPSCCDAHTRGFPEGAFSAVCLKTFSFPLFHRDGAFVAKQRQHFCRLSISASSPAKSKRQLYPSKRQLVLVKRLFFGATKMQVYILFGATKMQVYIYIYHVKVAIPHDFGFHFVPFQEYSMPKHQGN